MERTIHCPMKTNQRSIIVRAAGVALYVRLPEAFDGPTFGGRPDILMPPM